MRALILAAGMGNRLLPLTNELPKCLVPVNGKPILHQQIECLLGNGIQEITVVAGYKAEVLRASVQETFPQVSIIINTDYAQTNNMFSAYLGKDAMKDGPFLMMNADVFFDASVIEALLTFPAGNAIVTDIGSYLEESMKVIEREGRLKAISKQISKKESLGCSIDVYKFSREGGTAFFAACQEYIQGRNERKLWSEVALNAILAQEAFMACPLQGRWMEIDDHDDLQKANLLFA